jgi:probable HAF family extracellular repeat protein
LAFGVSADASVVVGVGDLAGGNVHAFRWTAGGGMQDIGSLAGFSNSGANAISADNQVIVGGCTDPNVNPRAFRWTAGGGMVNLGTLPGASQSVANDVSADGSIIVGETENTAFRWTQAGGVTPLQPPFPATFSTAKAITPDGLFIGGSYTLGGGLPLMHAALWTPAGPRDFQLQVLGSIVPAGWRLSMITGISDDGLTFIGIGDHSGVSEGWVATVPSPATGLVLAGAAVCAAVRRRREK